MESKIQHRDSPGGTEIMTLRFLCRGHKLDPCLGNLDPTCCKVWQKKIWHKWTYLWNRNRLTDVENRLVVASGRMGEGGLTGSLELADANYYIWTGTKIPWKSLSVAKKEGGKMQCLGLQKELSLLLSFTTSVNVLQLLLSLNFSL